MPNWCHNILILYHEDCEMIKKVKEAVEKEQLLNNFVPGLNNDNENDEWCIKKWCTKDESDIIEFTEQDNNTAIIKFYTAWSPPIIFYDALTEKGFDTKAVYKEEGMMFIGQYINGDQQHFELNFETYKDYLPEFILSFYEDELNFNKNLHFCTDDLK